MVGAANRRRDSSDSVTARTMERRCAGLAGTGTTFFDMERRPLEQLGRTTLSATPPKGDA
jgi:hypothetical protein